jgi:hypothetical protein
MKITQTIKLTCFALPLALGALAACGPDKDESPGEKTEDAVEEAGDSVEEGAEEVGDEIDDATDRN